MGTVFLAIFVTSFALASGLALTASTHGRFTMDLPGAAVQKVHSTPVPRVGGIAIFVALITASAFVHDPDASRILQTLLVSGAPALVVGLLEDVTKRIGVGARFVALLLAGFTACWLGGVTLHHVDVPGLDSLLAIAPVAVAFTAFSVTGVANAINIIDGLNGLASGATVIALAALGVIAASVGDLSLALVATILAAAVAGFWLVNFPWGKLFLGDGGAYFSGFALAWLAILLPVRNPGVSAWASLLACGYPIIEVLYSIARRWGNGTSPGQADCRHLHSLVAQRIVRPRMAGVDPTMQNSAVSVLMWMCAAVPALLGVTFYASTPWLALGAAACVLLYHWLYRLVARA